MLVPECSWAPTLPAKAVFGDGQTRDLGWAGLGVSQGRQAGRLAPLTVCISPLTEMAKILEMVPSTPHSGVRQEGYDGGRLPPSKKQQGKIGKRRKALREFSIVWYTRLGWEE